MNLPVQSYHINKQMREQRNGHKAFVIWFTGLSGSGKSTLANLLEQRLFEQGRHVYVLDGDNVRNGINKDLGFSKEGRKENIRRVAEIAKLFSDAGYIVITAFISPYIEDREMARTIIGNDDFAEVFVDASLQCCIKRDVKGMYARALAGKIEQFTGISDAYEPPVSPFMHLDTETNDVQQCVQKILDGLGFA